jgi:hypothetical protein
LAPACWICNAEKGTLTAGEYRAYRMSEALALRSLIAEYETLIKGRETPEMEAFLVTAVSGVMDRINRLEGLS